jgi:hypothetical protein
LTPGKSGHGSPIEANIPLAKLIQAFRWFAEFLKTGEANDCDEKGPPLFNGGNHFLVADSVRLSGIVKLNDHAAKFRH